MYEHKLEQQDKELLSAQYQEHPFSSRYLSVYHQLSHPHNLSKLLFLFMKKSNIDNKSLKTKPEGIVDVSLACQCCVVTLKYHEILLQMSKPKYWHGNTICAFVNATMKLNKLNKTKKNQRISAFKNCLQKENETHFEFEFSIFLKKISNFLVHCDICWNIELLIAAGTIHVSYFAKHWSFHPALIVQTADRPEHADEAVRIATVDRVAIVEQQCDTNRLLWRRRPFQYLLCPIHSHKTVHLS